MFRIGVLEIALTCGVGLLILVIPLIVSSFAARINRRLDKIEHELKEKK
jgi:hypothetical protein